MFFKQDPLIEFILPECFPVKPPSKRALAFKMYTWDQSYLLAKFKGNFNIYFTCATGFLIKVLKLFTKGLTCAQGLVTFVSLIRN